MEGDKTLSTVNIFGNEYRIKGPNDQEYGRVVAEFVNQRMREVADRQRITSPMRVAILTLLNVADELFQERRQAERRSTSIEDRARHLEVLLAGAVEGGPDGPASLSN
jgi:cell division protein ZapA